MKIYLTKHIANGVFKIPEWLEFKKKENISARIERKNRNSRRKKKSSSRMIKQGDFWIEMNSLSDFTIVGAEGRIKEKIDQMGCKFEYTSINFKLSRMAPTKDIHADSEKLFFYLLENRVWSMRLFENRTSLSMSLDFYDRDKKYQNASKVFLEKQTFVVV